MVFKAIQKHQQKRKSVLGRRLQGVHSDKKVDGKDDNDDVSLLELALYAKPMNRARSEILHPGMTPRPPTPPLRTDTASGERISGSSSNNNKTPPPSKQTRDDEGGVAAVPKHKKDYWIRPFHHRAPADSREAAQNLPSCQIRITPTLLTGLVAPSNTKKRSASNNNTTTTNNNNNNDCATGYLRLLPTTPAVFLVDGSPDILKSLRLRPTPDDGNNISPKAVQSCVVWTDSHLAHDSSRESLTLATSAAVAKEPVVTLEVGIHSSGIMIPLGTTTFQPGTTEAHGEQRQLKVEKLRKNHASGLFRKLQHGGKNKESEYRLSREACLSIQLDVIPSDSNTAPSSVNEAKPKAITRTRSLSPVSLGRVFSSFSMKTEDQSEHSTVDGQNNAPALPLLLSAACCCCCFGDIGAGVASDVRDNESESVRTEDESACDDSATGKSANVTVDGKSIRTSRSFGMPSRSLFFASWFGHNDNSHLQGEQYGNEDGIVGTNVQIPGTQSTRNGVHVATDGQSTHGERFVGQASGMQSTAQASWPLIFTACCFGHTGTTKLTSDRVTAGTDGESTGAKSAAQVVVTSVAADGAIVRDKWVHKDQPAASTTCCGCDEDVESLRALRQSKVETTGADTETAQEVSTTTSYSGTETGQVGLASILRTWCGEEDVESLRPGRFHRKLAGPDVKTPAQQVHVMATSPSDDKGGSPGRMDFLKNELTCRNVEPTSDPGRQQTEGSGKSVMGIAASSEKSALATKLSSTNIIPAWAEDKDVLPVTSLVQDIENKADSLDGSVGKRHAKEILDGYNIVGHSSSSSSSSGKRREKGQRFGCFLFLSELGADSESFSSSSDSSLSIDSASTGTEEFSTRDNLQPQPDDEVNLSPVKVEKLARVLNIAQSDLIRHINNIDDTDTFA